MNKAFKLALNRTIKLYTGNKTYLVADIAISVIITAVIVAALI